MLQQPVPYKYSPDVYWQNTEISYPHYPTIRHRTRFILNAFAAHAPKKENLFVFDYGCGLGRVLEAIGTKFKLNNVQLGGCDISAKAVESAKQHLQSPYLFSNIFPKLDIPCDVIVCCEVIEHTTDYKEILRWAYDHLAPGGVLILTTQAGKIHASDRYTGHTQHFRIIELKDLLKTMGFQIRQATLWGFPLFTAQKYLTNYNFEAIRQNYLEGELSLKKKIVFEIAYRLYCGHDAIPFGPQIYMVVAKPK